MAVPKRVKQYEGRYALVDGIPYQMPVSAKNSPALMAGFSCDWEKANALLPGNEIHALKLPNGRGALLITVINYLETSIGKYIEYSIAIGCTRGSKPAPPILNALMMKTYGTGQYILDLPVSSEISVKGGKGIWGMPKHKANLSFEVTDTMVTSHYEKDGQFAFRIEMTRPKSASIKINIGATNYCRFRKHAHGLLYLFQIQGRSKPFQQSQSKPLHWRSPKSLLPSGYRYQSRSVFHLFHA
ncbi:MAG: acetoacetate decarboxylase family protein [Cyclobacteriaceae bacterium]|nr:acetoacetate decarboxylase family protein [Cyclobacteriaceae bacterium]